jgi:hypothetical protein
MTNDATSANAKPPDFDVLKWLGERRDGFLVGGAILYGLGYLVWSYNAWLNHLGALPALEFQYVASGIVPAAILGLAWTATVFFSKLRAKLEDFYERHELLRWMAIGAFTVLPTVLYVFPKFDWTVFFRRPGAIPYFLPINLALTYLILLAFIPQKSEGKLTQGMDFMLRLYRYVLSILFCWASLFLYLGVYPHLPQQLGGPEPRCAYVDLVRDETAPPTFSALASPSSPDPEVLKAKVVRSNRLDVYFSSGDYLLVRPASTAGATTAGTNTPADPIYELRKDMIRAVQWCK